MTGLIFMTEFKLQGEEKRIAKKLLDEIKQQLSINRAKPEIVHKLGKAEIKILYVPSIEVLEHVREVLGVTKIHLSWNIQQETPCLGSTTLYLSWI
jgi:hypothetical protein